MISETRLNSGWEINILKPIAPAKNAKLTAGWYVPNVFVIVFTSFRYIFKSVIKADLVGRAKRPTLSVSVR